MLKVGDVVRLTKEAMFRFPDKPRGNYVITKIYKEGGETYIIANGIDDNYGNIRGMYSYRFELADKRNTNKSKYTT